MTALEDRQRVMGWIEEAHGAGARLASSCALMGLDLRTLQRWRGEGLAIGDRRPQAERPVPAHALTPEERAEILRVANEPRFAALPPAQIMPQLADTPIRNRTATSSPIPR
jgi:putative transposase